MNIFQIVISVMVIFMAKAVSAGLPESIKDNQGTIAKSVAKLDAKGSTWLDGDRKRTFWLALSEVILRADKASVNSAANLINQAYTEFPGAEILAANETYARIRLPQAFDPTQLADRLQLMPQSAGIKTISGVFYASPAGIGRPFFHNQQMIVHFQRPYNQVEAKQWAEEHQVLLIKSLQLDNAFLFSCLPGQTCLEQANQAYQDDHVRYAYPNWQRPRQQRFVFAADLEVTQSASPEPVSIGEELTYKITVINKGLTTAIGVHLEDVLPVGVTLKSIVSAGGACSGRTVIECNFGSLFPRSSKVVEIVVIPTQTGELENIVSVDSSSNDAQASNNTSTALTTVNENSNSTNGSAAFWNEPLFFNQWYLENTGQGSGVPGADINVIPVWNGDIYGAGIQAAIVDDGLEIQHEDIAANVVPNLSKDFVSNDNDPTAGFHGTSVAGILAASGENNIGMTGTAPRTGLVGLRLLGGNTEIKEAEALKYRYDIIDLYNNSWGPPDDGQGLSGPGPLTKAALVEGVTNGRNGKGVIYCWAGGNGGNNDNSNYDGYANSRYTIAVGASTNRGIRASYSEKGANLLVNAPSSGGTLQVTTTDRTGSPGLDSGNYTDAFGGTSAAAPLACGALALLLEANPALTWRDVQSIIAITATQNDPNDADWTSNGAGFLVNHKYGFGRIDIAAAINAAENWDLLEPEQSVTASATPRSTIPDNNVVGVSSSIEIDDNLTIESVEVFFSADDHAYWGDLEIRLIAPSGLVSILAEEHNSGRNTALYDNWLFSSMRYLGESAKGTWTLEVRDLAASDTGTFQAWTLKINGTKGSQITGQSDISIDMVDSPDPVVVGEQLRYSLNVINNGPGAATEVTVVDDLPLGVTLVSANASQGNCTGSTSLICNLGNLGNGASVAINIVVTPTAIGEVTNSASVNAKEDDANTSNNSDITITSVIPEQGELHSLLISVRGNGTIVSNPQGIDCPGDCAEDYPDGAIVTLTAIPDNPSRPVFWTGACSGIKPDCTVQVTKNLTANAFFF